MKRKAEDRAKKAEEKAKARKTQEKAAQKANKATAKIQKRVRSTKRKRPQATTGGSSALPTADSEPRPKVTCSNEETMKTEECCACSGLYSDDVGTGRDWLECACCRWIHESMSMILFVMSMDRRSYVPCGLHWCYV